MRLFEGITRALCQVPVSRHCPISHLAAPDVFETQSGALGLCLELTGHSFDGVGEYARCMTHQTWHDVLLSLDERFHLSIHVHRKPSDLPLLGQATGFAQQVLEQQWAFRQKTPLFEQRFVLTLMFQGAALAKGAGALSHLLLRFSDKKVNQARTHVRAAALANLYEKARQIEGMLTSFKPVRLGPCSDGNSLLQFLGGLLNGGVSPQFQTPATLPLPKSNPSAKAPQGGHLGRYLSARRLYFGDVIQFQGPSRDDVRFGVMMTIKRYPEQSQTLFAEQALSLPVEYIQTHHFSPINQQTALTKIKRQLNRMAVSGDPAISQVEHLAVARDEVGAQRIGFGHYQHSLCLLAHSVEALEAAVQLTYQTYVQSGMVPVRETVGQQPLFFSMLPGNQRYALRQALLSTQNVADFCPLYNYAKGERHRTHLDDAVLVGTTPGYTPYFVHLHGRGNKDNPPSGHTLIVAPTGGGKTAWMTYLDCHLQRFAGRSWFFDVDGALSVYIKAQGGDYWTLNPTGLGVLKLNPFLMPDTPENRTFCSQWLGLLCVGELDDTLSAESEAQCQDCVAYAFEQLAPNERSLTHVVGVLSKDFVHWPALRRFLQATEAHGGGLFADVFDHAHDTLNLDSHVGFDATYLLDDNTHPVLREAVLRYLLYRVKAQLAQDGLYTRIYIDEAWRYFDSPMGQKTLPQWSMEIRKKNGQLILAVHDPKLILQAGGALPILVNQCVTQCFFPNPMADEDYIRCFALSDEELAFIQSSLPGRRMLLLKQQGESTLLDVDLSHLGNLLSVLAPSSADIQKARQYQRDFKEQWLNAYLKGERSE